MEFKQRERILIILVFACLGLLAADRLVVTPLLKLWQERSARIAQLETALAEGRFLLDRKESIERRWNEMQARGLPIEAAAAQERVLQSVNRWAQTSRLAVKSLSFVPAPAGDRQERRLLVVQTRLEGNLEQIARFLYELETDALALRLETMDISARDDPGSALVLNARFSALQVEGQAS